LFVVRQGGPDGVNVLDGVKGQRVLVTAGAGANISGQSLSVDGNVETL
jgi:hypothetical protein